MAKWKIEKKDYYFVSKRVLFWWRCHVWTFTYAQAIDYIHEQDNKPEIL